MVKEPEYGRPTKRPLKAFTFDPSLGNAGTTTINIPYEDDLMPGPRSEALKLKIIDYDASNDCYYPPINLDNPAVLISGGLEPSESDPRTHQQMVYAVIRQTMERFRFALGRNPKWQDGSTLRVLPHAMQEANAFYSRDGHLLAFGYFRASKTDPGHNLPGQVIFSCLSHDIVAHETTHALIDGQKSYFLEQTSPDTPAFHEAFADIIALFLHFAEKDALLDVIQKTGGRIYNPQVDPEVKHGREGLQFQAQLSQDNPLVALAQQFGEAMGTRRALRAALGTKPNSRDLEKMTEAHDRGSILVAAVFDAFFTIYVRRTRDLFRLAQAHDGDDLHPDLAQRLASEAMKTAEHFSNICIRALDYCPPVDIQFGDFLRAIVTSDGDLVSDDPLGYRHAFIEAFRLRGIRPQGVTSYAEDSLRWKPPVGEPLVCEGLRFDLFNGPNREEGTCNATTLHDFAEQHREALRLTPGQPVAAHSFHPVQRIGPDGQLHLQIVAELTQMYKDVPLDADDPDSPTFNFYGGTTVVMDNCGKVLFGVGKPLGLNDTSNQRLAQQREFYAQLDSESAIAAYLQVKDRPYSFLDEPNATRMRFDAIHRGF